MVKRILLLSTIAFTIFACKSEDETLIPNQVTTIENFLNNNELEYEVVGGVYRHFGAPRGTENVPTVENGSRVEFMFEIYQSNYTKITGTLAPNPLMALSSNKPYVHRALEAAGFDTRYWPKDVYSTVVGSEDLIDGLNSGLTGCREGDSVLLFITSDLALKDVPVGPVAENSALLYILNIESVTK